LKDYISTISILENISDAVFILDTSGKIEYVNKSALSLLQADLWELLGKYIDEIIADSAGLLVLSPTGEARPHISQRRIISQLRRGVFTDIEATLVYKTTVVPVKVNFNVIPDREDDIKYIIVTVREISRREYLEQDRKQRQAFTMFGDRLRTLGELFAGVVHELSQPLSAMKLSVEMVHSSLVKGEYSTHTLTEKCVEMLTSINRLADIVAYIRLFATQTEDQTYSMVNINQALDNACRLTSFEMERRNIKLNLRKGKEIPFVVERAIFVEQLFVNLLINARDAFDEGERSGRLPGGYEKVITIVTDCVEDKWVEVTLEDNAGGMDPKIVDRIFDPFFTTRESSRNLGVGLTIAQGIVTSMGGDINVEVKPEVGTKFTIRIPVTRKDEREQLLTLIETLLRR